MNKFTKIAAAFAACAALAQSAYAGDMAVFGDSVASYNKQGLINVYANAPGDTGTSISTLSAATLSGIELLWLTQPASPYTSAQLGVLASYLAGGGRIAFLGEHGQIAPTQNNNISAAIAALGGNITITNNVLDTLFRTANRTGAGDGGIILNDPLTAGVNQYEYAAFAQLNLGAGARALMLGDDGVSV
jgi:hypothetical protein